MTIRFDLSQVLPVHGTICWRRHAMFSLPWRVFPLVMGRDGCHFRCWNGTSKVFALADPTVVSGIAFGLGTTYGYTQRVNAPAVKPLYDQDLPLPAQCFRGTNELSMNVLKRHIDIQQT